mgnify:FL=1
MVKSVVNEIIQGIANKIALLYNCLLYTSDAADEL